VLIFNQAWSQATENRWSASWRRCSEYVSSIK